MSRGRNRQGDSVTNRFVKTYLKLDDFFLSDANNAYSFKKKIGLYLDLRHYETPSADRDSTWNTECDYLDRRWNRF
jgi:hypothetical protein